MATIRAGDDVFESYCDLVEVTSSHRPDTSWRFVDASGHEHRWFADGKPAEQYRPIAKHDVPSTVSVFDGWGYWEDGERYAITHLECSQCGARVEPGYRPDDTTQYIQGLRHFTVNGERVTREQFEARAKQAGLL